MKQINRDKQIWKKNSERTHVEEPRPLREMQVLLMLSCTPAMEMKETVSWKGECSKWANGAVHVINAHIIKIWNWYSVTINRQLAYTNTNVLFLWNPFTCCLWFLLFTRLATWEAKHKNSGICSQCVIHSCHVIYVAKLIALGNLIIYLLWSCILFWQDAYEMILKNKKKFDINIRKMVCGPKFC